MDILGYTDGGAIRVTINGEEMAVPDDMGNRHRREIAEWEDAGNTIPPYVPFAAALPTLSRRQTRIGLVLNGITLDDVEAVINAIEDPQQRAIAMIEWQDAQQFERGHPLIAQVGAALGLTEAQIDTMWEDASTL